MLDFSKYIVINPNIRFGKPSIIGTKITVHDVLNWLANDMTIEDILNDFPELVKEQINACLLYAAHRENGIKVAQ